MNVLDTILKQKRKEVEERSKLFPVNLLEKSIFFDLPTISLKKSVREKSGIIAEIKRKSPSKGIINPNVSIADIARGYFSAGVSGISVLTDAEFFGGSNEDLMTARKYASCPILRKDFIISEYQIIEAKSIGADAILLIAAALSPENLKAFARFAHSLKLEVLMEVHDENELLCNQAAEVDLIGVNNRNLKTFEVSIETSIKLSSAIQGTQVKVSESGIDNPNAILELKRVGFQGFLIGQKFMEEPDPGKACTDFIDELRKAELKV